MENITNAATQLGKLGGKKSVESRFAGKSKEDISEIMRRVRMSPESKALFESGLQDMVDSINKSATSDSQDIPRE